MAWGFKKRIKIAPGLHINVGKKGVSARVGGRVAGVTVGTNGARVSANLPGTGLSVQKRLSTKAPRPMQTGEPLQNAEPPISSFNWRLFLGMVAALVVVVLFGKGV